MVDAWAASAPEVGRRPWSTWIAVTRQSAALARMTSAVESAPPENAHSAGVPGGGKVQRRTSP